MLGEYRAVVTADTHLAPAAWSSRPELAGDSYVAFDQIYSFASIHDIPVILAGDVFDKSYVDPYSLHRALFQINGHRRETFYIQGQHEFNRRKPWLDLAHQNIRHVHQELFYVNDTPVYGLDFTPASSIAAAFAKIPKEAEVLIAHQVWQEHMGVHCGSEAAFKDVPHVKTIITGDFHGHKITKVKAADGRQIQCLSPGSTCLQAIDEDASKYFFAWLADGSFESVKLKSRPVYRLRVISAEAFELTLASLRQKVVTDSTLPVEIQKPILQVEFFDNVPEVATRVTKAVGDNAFLFFKPLTASRKPKAEAIEDGQTYSTGLAGHLHLAAAPESPEFQTALRLLRSADRKAEVAAIVQESLAAKIL